jgi:hypothetical protein
MNNIGIVGLIPMFIFLAFLYAIFRLLWNLGTKAKSETKRND